MVHHSVSTHSIRFFLACLLFLCVFEVSHAYVPVVVEPGLQSDMYRIDDPVRIHYHYGMLQNFPHTYEVVIPEPLILSVSVMVPDMEGALNTVNGIIVKREGRQGSVREVARLLAADASWESFYEPWGGDSYRRGTSFAQEMEPGTYRIEVSTPDNTSPYVLVVGTETGRGDVSYFEMLRRVKAVKEFYGRSPLTVVLSPYVYLPLLMLFFVVGGTIGYRRRYSR